jgi:hypothetical protein
LCVFTLILDIYLVVAIFGLLISLVFAPFRSYPYSTLWWGPGWAGIVVGFILAYLLYPHCGFLHLPI